jgi:hypothetical protein
MVARMIPYGDPLNLALLGLVVAVMVLIMLSP